MHHPLTKITILFAILIVIFAGLAPRPLHAATLSPGKESAPFIANPSAALTAGRSEKPLAVAQPVGSLITIAWNDLEIADSRPAFFELLIFSPYDELRSDIIVSGENAKSFADDSTQSYRLLSGKEPLGTLYQDKVSNERFVDYCFACHGSPNSINRVTATFDNEQSLQAIGYSWLVVSCNECHPPQPKQISWLFRGVE